MLCGSEQTSNSGKTFLSYQGIPFAAPPVGRLRLARPEPALAWPGVLDVSGRPRVVCPQLNYFQPEIIDGQEDCLYLNVYTPGYTSPHLNSKCITYLTLSSVWQPARNGLDLWWGLDQWQRYLGGVWTREIY